jgi:hypothetical protein
MTLQSISFNINSSSRNLFCKTCQLDFIFFFCNDRCTTSKFISVQFLRQMQKREKITNVMIFIGLLSKYLSPISVEQMNLLMNCIHCYI